MYDIVVLLQKTFSSMTPVHQMSCFGVAGHASAQLFLCLSDQDNGEQTSISHVYRDYVIWIHAKCYGGVAMIVLFACAGGSLGASMCCQL